MFSGEDNNNIWKNRTTQFIGSLKKNLLSYKAEAIDKIIIFLDVSIHVLDVEPRYYYEYEVNYGQNVIEYGISLRIGQHKKYVVKRVGSLLEAIIKNEPMYFGKEFTFDPNIHTFDENDKKLIDFLIDIYIAKGNIRGIYSPRFSSKEVDLSEIQFIKILRLIKEREFSGTIFSDQCNNICVKEEELPLDIRINKVKSGISIKFNGDRPQEIGDNLFYLLGNIYIPPKRQGAIYSDFYDMLKSDNDKMIIGEKSYGLLGSYIIPALKSISKNVNISPLVKQLFESSKLTPKLYFDNVDNDIYCKVIFDYGKIQINPLLENSVAYINESILIRSVDDECEIINILERYKFKVGRNCYELCDVRQEYILEFISEGMEKLRDKCEIYCTDAFKNVKIYSSSRISSSIRINDEDLLEFSFNIDGINKEDLSDIYKSLKLKKKYHKLKNGGFVMLNSSGLEEFMDTVNYLGLTSKQICNDVIMLPKYNSMYLDEKLKSKGNLLVEKNKKFRETISNMKDIGESDFEIPSDLNKTLREYQKTGFKWFATLAYCGFGGILADEMGLGKTLQAISYMRFLKESKEDKCILVVCPTSLVYNWENEIKKFSPELKVLVVSGNKSIRQEAIDSMKEYDVIITSYPLVRIDIDSYSQEYFACVFIDEAQNIKNANSINSKSVKMLKAKYRFALTGTPIENNLSELWSIFDFIMPGYLLSQGNFRKLYEMPVIKNDDRNALIELNKHVAPFILRRYKKDVIKELPEKIQHKLLIDLNEEQKKVYASYIKMYKEELNHQIMSNGFAKSKIKILSLLTRLRQICCDPSSFIEDYRGDSAKIEALLDIVRDSLSEKHRILVFSQFTSILKNIKDKLDDMEISSFYLDGSTLSRSRIEMVNAFNEGENNLFLISLKAGGTGLNLIGADTVIHFDPWWNPAVEDQATDRAHRIGQKKTVEVINMITKGTIEEKINLLQDKKKNIFDSVVNNVSNENVLATMDEEEIMDLFTSN